MKRIGVALVVSVLAWACLAANQRVVFQNPNDPDLDKTAPTVTISTPTSSATYDAGTDATLATLAGTSSDATGVATCRWSSDQGTSGTATTTGAGAWTVSNIALEEGDNVLTVTCLDPGNNAGTDVLTVTRASGGATPAYRQSGYFECQPDDSCAGGFDVPGNSADPVQAGSLMVVTSRTDNDTAINITSVTTNRGDTCAAGTNIVSATDFRLVVWGCPNAVGGSTTVTVNHSGGVSDFQMRISLAEYSGVATGSMASIMDDTATAQGGSTCTAGTITTTGVNRLIHVSVAADGDSLGHLWNPQSGLTSHDLGGPPTGSDKTRTGYKLATTATDYNLNGFTNINDGTSACVAIAFKPGS